MSNTISSRVMTFEDMQGLKIKTPFKMKSHSFGILKGVGKQYCHKCGLVALNNPFSKWCIDKGCNHSDHSQYNNKLKQLTRTSK